jgi:thiol:disulfide interchange protein
MARFHATWPRWFCAAIVAALGLAQVAHAQQMPEFSFGGGLSLSKTDPARITAEFTPATADQPALLFVTATMDRGYHMFAVDQPRGGPQATVIELAEGAPAKVLAPFRPTTPYKSHIDEVAWVGLEIREHEGKVTWAAPIELAAGVDPATAELPLNVSGQACKDACFNIEATPVAKLGRGVPLPADFLTAAATTAGAPSTTTLNESAVDSHRSLVTVALYGILGGLILNLMPCVLPVLGLKLLSFAKQGGESRTRVLGLNIAYSAGLISVFMVLATLAVAVQLGLGSRNFDWGELNTFTSFKVAMTALVFAMALAFLGVWELPIPGIATSRKATELSSQEGPVGAFCMGIFTTLLATPCSGPLLGPIFGYTIGQPPAVTYMVFGAIGLGMALPYLLVGAFPAIVAWLPKPGEWMDTFKQVIGFVLLGSVVYLFSTLNSDYFLPTLALIFAIWFGCWIIGRTPAWAEPEFKRWAWVRGIAAAAVLGGASFVLLAPSRSELPWQPYSPAALAEARAQGKTVMVDFTANWCLTCKLNLKTAINRAAVRDLIKQNGVVPLLADWTDENDTIKQALAELNSRSIPLMAIYPADPNADVLVLPDVLTQSDVLEALQQAGPSRDVAAVEQGTITASRPGEVAGGR